jgi:cephalosporin hydroxylase
MRSPQVRKPGLIWLSLLLLASACQRSNRPEARISEVSMADDSYKGRMVRGVIAGQGLWRWTEPTFALSLDPPSDTKPVWLEMDFSVPQEQFEKSAAVTVTAKVNGIEVGKQTYPKPERFLFAAKVPAEALRQRPATIEISADHSARSPEGQTVGLIAMSVGLKEFEQTAEYRAAQMVESRAAYDKVLEQRNLKMPVEKQRELMRLFHDLPIWDSLSFQNVRIIKNPLDLWMLQQIAYEVQPDFVIETGTWYGGSALYWSHTLNGMGRENARVLTVDIQNLTQAASTHPLWKKYVEFSLGSSTDPKIVAKFAEKTKGWRTLINLDSDHSRQHVLNELRLYAPLVSPGSYIAVEDTHLDGIPTHPEEGPGPMAAVRQFLAEGGDKDFEQDFTREAMVMTSYPGGWLRRKTK